MFFVLGIRPPPTLAPEVPAYLLKTAPGLSCQDFTSILRALMPTRFCSRADVDLRLLVVNTKPSPPHLRKVSWRTPRKAAFPQFLRQINWPAAYLFQR